MVSPPHFSCWPVRLFQPRLDRCSRADWKKTALLVDVKKSDDIQWFGPMKWWTGPIDDPPISPRSKSRSTHWKSVRFALNISSDLVFDPRTAPQNQAKNGNIPNRCRFRAEHGGTHSAKWQRHHKTHAWLEYSARARKSRSECWCTWQQNLGRSQTQKKPSLWRTDWQPPWCFRAPSTEFLTPQSWRWLMLMFDDGLDPSLWHCLMFVFHVPVIFHFKTKNCHTGTHKNLDLNSQRDRHTGQLCPHGTCSVFLRWKHFGPMVAGGSRCLWVCYVCCWEVGKTGFVLRPSLPSKIDIVQLNNLMGPSVCHVDVIANDPPQDVRQLPDLNKNLRSEPINFQPTHNVYIKQNIFYCILYHIHSVIYTKNRVGCWLQHPKIFQTFRVWSFSSQAPLLVPNQLAANVAIIQILEFSQRDPREAYQLGVSGEFVCSQCLGDVLGFAYSGQDESCVNLSWIILMVWSWFFELSIHLSFHASIQFNPIRSYPIHPSSA